MCITNMEAYTCASQTHAWKPDARANSHAHEARVEAMRQAGICGILCSNIVTGPNK